MREDGVELSVDDLEDCGCEGVDAGVPAYVAE